MQRKRPLAEVARPAYTARAHRLVVKVGTGVLSKGDLRLHRPTMAALARELSEIRAQGREVVLVSSGAILAGMAALGFERRPQQIPLKQAAAAVGQSHLMRAYEEAFQPHGQQVAQVLLTREDLRHRTRYLNARNTLFALLRLRVIPIINENDTVAVDEIRFGDNDTLSALVAHVTEADLLVILTDTDGVYTADPRKHPDAALIPVVGADVRGAFCADEGPSPTGSGGISSKLAAARQAAQAGVPTVVANGFVQGILGRVLAGEEAGTLFLPRTLPMRSRQRWLAFASAPRGAMVVDAGAREALLKGGKSLLSSGIRGTRGSFKAGDPVSILGPDRAEFARGLTNYGRDDVERIKGLRSGEIAAALGSKPFDEVIHRDNLVLLET
ncbi:MAG TPA: glutamate 5-kinase [Candidatus Methylomirabilis sp.]|jgi:glutamate 5-kinase